MGEESREVSSKDWQNVGRLMTADKNRGLNNLEYAHEAASICSRELCKPLLKLSEPSFKDSENGQTLAC